MTKVVDGWHIPDRDEKCFQMAKNLGLDIVDKKVQVPVHNWFRCNECAHSSHGKRAYEHSKRHDGNWSRGVSINYMEFERYPDLVEYVEV